MKKAVSFRLEEEVLEILKAYSETNNLSQADVLERLVTTLKVDGILPDKVENPKPTDYMTEARFNHRTADIVTHFNSIFHRLEELERYKLPGNAYNAAIEFNEYYYDLLETLKPFLQSLAQADMEILDGWLKRLQDPKANSMIGVVPEALGQRS